MPWCPKCRKRYAGVESCPKCGGELAVVPLMPRSDQIVLMAALSIGLTFAGMLILGPTTAVIGLILGGWPSLIASSTITVALFTAVAYRVGCYFEGRLAPAWTVPGWLVGSALFSFLPAMVMVLDGIQAWNMASCLVLMLAVPGTGATAVLYGAKLGMPGRRGFTIPFLILTILGAAALCGWLSLPVPDWFD